MHRHARSPWRSSDVVELGLGPPVADLHAHHLAIDGDLVEAPGGRPPLGRRGAHPEGAGRGVDDVAQARRGAPASVRTCRTCPGLPFFMVTGLTQASNAPASRAADTA